MAPSRRNSNGRSPLVNQQRQITAFFSKSTSSPSPVLSKPNNNPKLNPNPTSSPSPSPPTPSPPNPKPQHRKPLLVIGASPSPSPSSSSLYAQDVVGRRIKVYWPLDKAWYEGTVKSFDNVTSKHLVVYDDDEEESLDLSKEKIEWVQEASSSSVKRLKRLRRGFPAVRKMVIEDDEVEESPKGGGDDGDGDGDDDDSSDEDWGKNAVVEDAEEEEDVELEDEEEDEDDAEERSKRKPSRKVEPKKRKLGGAEKLEPAKKSKSVGEVGSVKGGFKFSVSEPTSNLESE